MTTVLAHGIVGRADLPIPAALFAAAAAMVLVVSFAWLAAGWTRPKLERLRERPWIRLPRAVDAVLGALGVVVFVVAAISCFTAGSTPRDNFGTATVYIGFWIGVPVLSLFAGDVFRLVSPWRAVGRAAGRLLGGATEPLPYPERLGRWPAVAGLAAFAIAELCWAGGQEPQTVGVLMLAYAAAQLVGMGLYGVEPWSRNGDAFGIYFGLFAAVSPLRRDPDGRLVLRRPLSGLVAIERPPGTIALICVAIGSTTFDGAKEGPLFNELVPSLQDGFETLGLSLGAALEWSFVLGLAVCIALVRGLFAFGVAAMPARPGRGPSLVHSLVPIAVAYVVAHYFSSLAYAGQSLAWLARDPFEAGGAGGSIDYGVVSATGIWYVQVVTLVAGHVAALVLAHDRALTVYGSARAAVRSQVCMLGLMVAFTCLGLWLLSVSNA